MDRLEILYSEYPGDPSWSRFVAVYKRSQFSEEIASHIEQAVGDEGIAIVLSAKLGERALPWMNYAVLALEGNTPLEVISNRKGGLTMLRTFIMRMPA